MFFFWKLLSNKQYFVYTNVYTLCYNFSMKKEAIINLRVSKELKNKFQTITESEDLTMSEVLETFMMDVVKKNKLPLNIKPKIIEKKPQTLNIPYIKKCVDLVISSSFNDKINKVFIFGSYATGQATAKSDVDLFVETVGEFSLFDLSELQEALENVLKKSVDIITNKEDSFFSRHIKKEQIQLYERI